MASSPFTISLITLMLLVTVGARENGSCGPDHVSKVIDCQNVDMGSCGNACCKLKCTVPGKPQEVMQTINRTLSTGGPDGYYTLQETAGGGLGFDNLTQYDIGVQYIGQVHHMTKVMHYNDTIDINIRPLQGGQSLVLAFSLSLIAGALGDHGQNYKNIMMIMKAAFDRFSCESSDMSCPPPEVHELVV